MRKRKKGDRSRPEDQREQRYEKCIRATIKVLFRSGKKFTAKRINQLTHSNDTRKQISELRRSGWNIQDLRQPDGCKLYWLAEDDRQRVFDFQGECL